MISKKLTEISSCIIDSLNPCHAVYVRIALIPVMCIFQEFNMSESKRLKIFLKSLKILLPKILLPKITFDY